MQLSIKKGDSELVVISEMKSSNILFSGLEKNSFRDCYGNLYFPKQIKILNIGRQMYLVMMKLVLDPIFHLTLLYHDQTCRLKTSNQLYDVWDYSVLLLRQQMIMT